jgi:hypothetical protein
MRKQIILANMVLVFVYALAMYFKDLPVAVMTYFIAGFGAFIQLLIPEKMAGKTVLLRNGIAVACMVVAAVILYRTPADLFAISSFSLSRLGEGQTSPQLVRGFYGVSATSYGVFAYINEMPIMVAGQAFLVLSLVIALLQAHYGQNLLDVIKMRWGKAGLSRSV